jgi:hypothetical protein
MFVFFTKFLIHVFTLIIGEPTSAINKFYAFAKSKVADTRLRYLHEVTYNIS